MEAALQPTTGIQIIRGLVAREKVLRRRVKFWSCINISLLLRGEEVVCVLDQFFYGE